jgi:hypothetical protein
MKYILVPVTPKKMFLLNTKDSKKSLRPSNVLKSFCSNTEESKKLLGCKTICYDPRTNFKLFWCNTQVYKQMVMILGLNLNMFWSNTQASKQSFTPRIALKPFCRNDNDSKKLLSRWDR